MLPSKTSLEISGFGLRKRELLIVGLSFILMLLILALPLSRLFVRIVLGVSLMAGGILLAFWRVKKEWTLEAWLWQAFKYDLRTRDLSRGFVPFARRSVRQPGLQDQAEPGWREQVVLTLPGWLSPQSNAALAGYVLSIALVLVLLAWVGTGGLRLIQAELQEIVQVIR